MSNTDIAELRRIVEGLKDDIRSGEMGPGVICRAIDKVANPILDRLEAAEARAAEAERRATASMHLNAGFESRAIEARAQLAVAQAERDAALAEVARLKGASE